MKKKETKAVKTKQKMCKKKDSKQHMPQGSKLIWSQPRLFFHHLELATTLKDSFYNRRGTIMQALDKG